MRKIRIKSHERSRITSEEDQGGRIKLVDVIIVEYMDT